MCLGAGLVVGASNYAIFSLVVSRTMRRLASAMAEVNQHMAAADCAGLDCAEGLHLDTRSDDAIGQTAQGFNTMLDAIALRMGREGSMRGLLQRLGELGELSEVAAAILQALMQTCQARLGLLWVAEGDELVLRASVGQDQGAGVPGVLDVGQGCVATALARGEPYLVAPEREGLTWVATSTPLGTFRPRAVLLVPLVFRQSSVGLVALGCREETLPAAAREMLDSLRQQAAPYLHTAALNQRMKDLAALDELTGVLNRRFGLRRLREEFGRSVRHGVPLSVLLIDIDHFKRFNDTWGHDAGDLVLRTVTRTIEKNLRAGDAVCRYGGEEILVIAPGTGLADVARLGERFRRSVEASVTPWEGKTLSVTMSLGAASWPNVPASQPEELVSAADAALYQAKHAGRNRTCAQHGERIIEAGELFRILGQAEDAAAERL